MGQATPTQRHGVGRSAHARSWFRSLERHHKPKQQKPCSFLKVIISTGRCQPSQSDLSFFFPPGTGTLLATAEPTALTPPATADTPPLTSPTPRDGTAATEVTAVLVRSKLLPPIQATPPTVAPTAPLVTLKSPPATLENMPAWGCGWSLLASVGINRKWER